MGLSPKSAVNLQVWREGEIDEKKDKKENSL
jgi:hypothetical protein